MSLDLDFSEKNIFIDLEFEKKEDVLIFLTEELTKQGYVQAAFKEAVLEREKVYPTGLPSLGAKIAIPHANHDLVNKTTIAMAVLNKPVTFFSMEDVEAPLDIEIVIMLAISEPHGQIEMLQRVVSIIQDEELTRKIVDSKSKTDILDMLKPYFYETQNQ
ncbi:PTS sugar transporter subunit IIA [Desemzia sp. FAM 23989]|uniref:PTS sugar transporter subunit IIA n=1 Tax=Desemzia sp. FAM 23989 TaxID=3259523 RepID=UPI00388A4C4D